MKEELTTKMHGEFSVSPETDIKHRVFSALTLVIDYSDEAEVKQLADDYVVTISDIDRYADEFYRLEKITKLAKQKIIRYNNYYVSYNTLKYS